MLADKITVIVITEHDHLAATIRALDERKRSRCAPAAVGAIALNARKLSTSIMLFDRIAVPDWRLILSRGPWSGLGGGVDSVECAAEQRMLAV